MKTFTLRPKPNSGLVRVKAKSLTSLSKRLGYVRFLLNIKQEK